MINQMMLECKLSRNKMSKMLKITRNNWWEEINSSVVWQDVTFFTLSALFALVSSFALIQLIRIDFRVPGYKWTTQKVFHLMNFIVNGVRALVFGLHKQVFVLRPKVLELVLLDLPGLVFFSTYTLLVLFWAQIYHQARSLPADNLKLFYILFNAVIYFIQVGIWIFLWLDDNKTIESSARIFVAAVSLVAAVGFLVYGGRLFVMLRQYPIESRGKTKKLYEVIEFFCAFYFWQPQPRPMLLKP
ncbi:hypothetical protein RND81_10G012000 [Saponaria officinalis]|uniref:THH1/TOM1/TOM3 domain-containing protein n=1 Tax=Saponaria officinalis TaxID=3572 RepID=A0AAW1HXI5_SAPOF